ncbi:MAG: protein kinase domain-containing protein [Actinomycetota bacterium]
MQRESVINNRYRIVQSLGKGGFGETFEVEEIDNRGTRKVLKVLHHFSNSQDQEKAISLFQREAEVLKRLHYIGIPKVEPDGYFTWQAESEARYCLVMEKIDGQTLDKWLENNWEKITESEAINWLKQLLEILDYVHEQGYIHRDIKPSNIMRKPDNQLVLIDWGSVKEITNTYLVKLVEDIPATKVVTDGYAPIEQIQGKPVPPSDFFALGRTLVYLLTGKEPIHLPVDDLTEQLIWRRYAPTVSDSLAELINWMMAVFPKDRPQSAKEILQALKNLQRDLSESNQQFFFNKRTKQFERLNLKKYLNTKKITILLGSLTFAFLIKNVILENLPDELFNLGSKREAKHLEQAEFLYSLALFLDPNYPEIYFSLGRVYEKRAEGLVPQEKKAKIDLAEAQYRKAISLEPTYDKPYNNLGRLLILKGQSNASIPVLKKGLESTKKKDVEYSLLKNLGWALKEQKQYEEATVYLQRALALDSKLAPANCLLALVLEQQGERAEASEKWKNCLRYASEDNFDERLWKSQAQERLKSQKMEK